MKCDGRSSGYFCSWNVATGHSGYNQEVVFRWRVKLRVITRDESLLEDKRLKIINIAQGPDGTSEVNALRMIPLDELESEGHVVGD